MKWRNQQKSTLHTPNDLLKSLFMEVEWKNDRLDSTRVNNFIIRGESHDDGMSARFTLQLSEEKNTK